MKKITFLLSAIFVPMMVACSPIATPEPTLDEISLKLGWFPSAQFLGFYVADDRGFYAEEGLIIRIDHIDDPDEGSFLPMLVADGSYDFSTAGAILRDAQTQGTPVTVISSILQFSPAVLFARADSGITTPADLAGRTVVVKTDLWQLMVERLLAQSGLTLDDIEPVSGGFDMTPFYENEVDVWAGFLTNEVIMARQQGLELVTFPLYEYGVDATSMKLITSHELLETNPDLAARFLRATIHGWEWAIENPQESIDLMIERFPDLADRRDFEIDSFEAQIPLVHPPGVQIGSINCEQWVDHDLFSSLDSTENLCTASIFEQAKGTNKLSREQ